MLVIAYEKTGRSKYLPHLDLLRAMGRIFRRTGIQVGFSQGFNPHMLLFFSPPLPLGTESKAEYITVAASCSPEEALKKFNAVSIEGIRARKVWEVAKNPNFAACSVCADYECKMEEVDVSALEKMFASDAWEVTFTSAKGSKLVDVRPDVHALSFEAGTCKARLSLGQKTLRADKFFAAFEKEGKFPNVMKTKLYVQGADGLLEADQFLDQIASATAQI